MIVKGTETKRYTIMVKSIARSMPPWTWRDISYMYLPQTNVGQESPPLTDLTAWKRPHCGLERGGQLKALGLRGTQICSGQHSEGAP